MRDYGFKIQNSRFNLAFSVWRQAWRQAGIQKISLWLVSSTFVCFLFPFFFLNKVFAQIDACDLLGNCGDEASESPEARAGSVDNIIKFFLGSIFAAFMIYGIVLIIKGAVSYIRSEGDEEQIEVGKNQIRAALVGLAMLIGGIIGLVLLFTVFGAAGITNQDINQPDGLNL